MLKERLDKRVKEYLEEKKRREEAEKIKQDTISNDAQRIWNQLSEHFESLDDSQLAEGVEFDVRREGYYLGDSNVIVRFKENAKYFEETLEKVMELAKADGIKSVKQETIKVYYFKYIPNIKAD